MKVVILLEYKTPKEAERNKKRYKFGDENLTPYFNKKRQGSQDE